MTGVFRISALATFKVLHKKASPANVKQMFGRDVQVAAKPARSVVKATPVKQLSDAVGSPGQEEEMLVN